MKNEEAELYIGIDIGGTEAKIGLLTGDGKIMDKVNVPVSFDHYETPILVTVNRAVGEFLKKHTEDKDRIRAIGVSATGAIDSKSGVVAGCGGHIRNWLGSPIREVLEKAYGLPVFALNDANAAALGEMWQGGAKGKSNVLVITIGTGVGGGIIVDGHILLGNHGFAGEIGYIKPPFVPEESLTGRGCYEDYASMSALIRMVEVAARKGSMDAKYASGTNGREIFDAVKSGDKILERITECWIGNIAAGIVSLVHIFNPEVILIGGGVSAQKEYFIDKLRNRVFDAIMDEFKTDLNLKAAELKNDAGMIGAVKFCLDSLRDSGRG